MFKMQIQIEVRQDDGRTALEWRDVHPTGGAAYTYETREEAERMLRLCYGTPLVDAARQRVVEV